MSDELPGMNELNLNRAVMMKIVQDYLQEHGGSLLEDVLVDGLRQDQEGDVFCIMLKSPERKTP